MGQELLKGDYIQADETPVDVQMYYGRGKNHQAYLWQYSRPTGPVVFDFRMGREREVQSCQRGGFDDYLSFQRGIEYYNYYIMVTNPATLSR